MRFSSAGFQDASSIFGSLMIEEEKLSEFSRA
jgi:hypothetical protein